MILESISLTNFKNISQAKLQFSPKLNCLLGDNGMGKSNLLDAIYFLSFCKSFTGAPDSMLIKNDEDFSMLQAIYNRRGAEETVNAAMQRGRRKSFKRSGKEYQRLSQHIGKFPLVLVSPADMELVNGAGEERRRLMDIVISQTDACYLDALIRYNRSLEQRNRMLRDGIEDPNLYLAIEMMLESAAGVIADARRKWIEQLSAIFQRYYAAIANASEVPSLAYKSHLAEPGTSLQALFNERRARDAALKYTTAGPHRDDIEMQLSGMPLRRIASQGQAKTYTIALRLAQYDFLKEATGVSPLLLLDDIFDKLDARRVANIIEVVASDNFGQIFITDTNRKHLDEILMHAGDRYSMLTVSDGTFTPAANDGSIAIQP